MRFARLQDIAFRFFAYSWRDTEWDYSKLTLEERRILSKEEFDEIVKRLREDGYL